MSKRFVVCSPDGSGSLFKETEFTNPSRAAAVKAFRTLYGEQDGFTLFEQVACIDPTGSCAGPDDASGETEVQ